MYAYTAAYKSIEKVWDNPHRGAYNIYREREREIARPSPCKESGSCM